MKRKKKKTKSIAKLHNEAAELLQLLVRLKAADDNGYCSCVTCGITKYYKKDGIQGGHFMPRGRAPTKLLEENIHPQCESCNLYGMKFHDASQVYTLYMIDMYGREEVDRIIALSATKHKWIRKDLEETITDLRIRIRDEEDRIT